MKLDLKSCIACFVLLFAFSLAYGASPEVNKDEEKDKEEICNLIKKDIKNGESAGKVVSASLRKGHKLCYVIRCAIDAGGNVDEIIAGAMAGGSTSDVISICTPLVTDPPKGSRSATLSPSSFK